MEPAFRSVLPGDASAIAAIYNPFISDSVVTFEESLIDERVILERVDRVRSLNLPWLVAEDSLDRSTILGYAYATPWRERRSYRFSCETAIYMLPVASGKGLGTRLYSTLLGQLQDAGMHVAVGGITLPNPASVRLHEKLGFQKVAHFQQVGWKFDQWLDVGFWQKTFL